MHRVIRIALLGGLIAAGACLPAPSGETKAEKPAPVVKRRVLVSVQPLAWPVAEVGGRLLESLVTVDRNRDWRTFAPSESLSPQQVVASVYIRCGLEFETPWIERMRTANQEMRDFDVLAGIDGVRTDGGINPFVWLHPERLKASVTNLEKGLCALYPEHEDEFAANAEAYRKRIDKLGARLLAATKPVAGGVVLAYDEGFRHFADAFGMTFLQTAMPERGFPAKQIDAIRGKAKFGNARIVFVPETFPAGKAEAMSKELKAAVIPVDIRAVNVPMELARIAARLESAFGESGGNTETKE